MIDFLHFLFTAPATGVIAMQAVIIAGLIWLLYLLYKQRTAMDAVADNHLSGLPEMQANVAKLVTLMESQAVVLQNINNTVIYIVARVNGGSGLPKNQ